MNRHKAYWSAMGPGEETEQSQISKDYEKMRNELKTMVDRFGFDEVVTELRRIKEGED